MMHGRRTGPLNRLLLILCGLVLMLAGAAGLAVGTGASDDRASVSARIDVPGRRQLITGERIHDVVANQTAVAIGLLIGVIVVLTGLAWLTYQLPRRPSSPVFRLHDDARDGVINCDSKVIAAAISDRVRAVPGVLDSTIGLVGTARHPELSANLKIDARTRIADSALAAVERIQSDYAAAFGTDLDRLTVRIAVGSVPVSSSAAVLTTTARQAARPPVHRVG